MNRRAFLKMIGISMCTPYIPNIPTPAKPLIISTTSNIGIGLTPTIERMRITSNGNVGITTNNPSSILEITS